METSSMETDEIVVENPIAEPVETDGAVPVEVSETRVEPPEMEKPPVQQVNMLDLTKLSPEVRQGYRVYIEMSADSYKNVTWPFMEPVDAEGLGLWDYHERIKEPMSFQQIGGKFNNYEYNSITEVIADIRLILENCYRYNGSDHWVSKLGHKMEKILEQKLALLNRSLRDKVSLEATMALKCDYIPAESTASEGTGRRRAAARVSYVNMINGEGSSSLLTRLKIQEDLEERERRRVRDKEKKEANLVLLQDLAEWEEKELGADVVKQLHSMWEIPSLAGLLFLLKDFLYIQDLSITELELSFVYASKSSLLARIFTALLITPHQRKSLFKKPPMKFKVWESKLCDRLNSWYKIIEKDGQVFTCHHLGLDVASFEMLGEVNPLLEKSYMDLTLHQRVWILKCLCDNSLVRDYDLREHLSSIAPTDQRDMYLGCDADSWSYLYFPIFSSSDLRIYKQCPLEVPTLSKRKKKVSPPPPPVATKPKRTPARPATPTQPRRNTRLRKLRSDTPSPEPETPPPPSPPPVQEEEEQEPVNTIPEGFELAALDVESLKLLSEKFAEPPPPPKKRGRRSKPPPPRKRCEVELHQTLLALLEELEQYEMSFSRHMSKAKIKIMKESQEPDPVDEPEEVVPAEEAEEWGSEESIGDEIEDAGAQNMSSDEDFVLDDEENKNKTPTPTQTTEDGEGVEKKGNVATQSTLPQKRKADEEKSIEKSKQSVASPGVNDDDDDPCSIAIQTAPPRFKKKKKKHSPVSELKTTAVCQTVGTVVPQPVGTVVPQSALNKTPQGTKNILHIPSGLQAVKEMKAVTAKSSASVNTTMSASSSVTTSAVSVSRAVSSTSTTQAVKNTSAVRIHPPKRPAILGSSTSAAAKPRPLVVVPSSQACSATSVQAVAASKNLQSTAVTLTQAKLLQSQASLSAALPAGVGKVMLVSSSGVPLQVLKTIPVSQSMVQGKTLSPSVLTTPGNTRVRIVSSTSSPSNPVGVVKLPSSSPLSTATSQLPSSASAKVAVSVAQKLPNVLTTAKQAGNVSASSASPVHPPVLLVQRSGAGGVVPLTVKGGTIVMPASSTSQQLVVIRPSSALTSSTTTTTKLLSGAGISVLGNAQIAQTALGHKVILQAPTSLGPKTATVTSNKPVVQAAKVTLESKPAQLKTTSQTMSYKPVTVTTTASTTNNITTNKTATATVTTASQSTLLATKSADSKPTCPALPVGNEQVVLGTVMFSELTAHNKQLSNVGSTPVCGTEVSRAVTKTLVSNCETAKGTVTQTEANVSSDTKREANVSVTQTMVNVFPDTQRVASSQATPTAVTVSQDTPTVSLDTQKVANVLQDSQIVSTSSQDTRTVATTSPDTQTVATVSKDIPTVSGDSQKGASVLQDMQTVGTLPDTQTVGTSLPDTRTVATTSPDTLKVATASPDTQTPATVSSETGLKQTSVTCEDKSIPAVTINTSENCQPENISNEHCKKATELDAKDTTNGCDPLLDLTCYETSVSDSAGCEESDDSAPNGLHPDFKTSLPCKLTETDVKLHNGTVCPDSKCEEKELDSVQQGHEVTKQNTNGIV